MSQTSYPVEAPEGFAGQVADAPGPVDILSRANEESTAVPFGLMTVPGTDGSTQFLLPSESGLIPLGVLAHQHPHETISADGLDEGETGNVLKRGRIWVVTEEAVAVDSDVYFRHTVDTTEQLGAFRTDADTDKADQLTNARWVKATSAAGIAQLDINLP